ncbi:MAG: EsaB/YukD family protein [Oscillospiraceae bacterium]|nr:EsaB/YukD family protein [Oscillospiraceae bacterium]
MILVDIYIPELDRSYDFSLQEQAPVSALVEELAEIVCQKERWEKGQDASGLLLVAPEHSIVFAPGDTLQGRGVTSGSRLMLL